MNALDVLNSPWAIVPDKLQEIQEIYLRHRANPKISLQELQAAAAAAGRPLGNERQPYVRQGGVAIVDVQGVLAKKANMFMNISGGSSMQMIASDFRAAMDDPNVHSIVLNVDSPGGTVDGTQQLANVIKSARGVKPVAAVADGMAASAAYWISTSAEKIYVADGTTQVGSIGVVAKHVDYSKAEDAAGIKVTEITAGKYKRIASEHAPLTQEGRQSIQDAIDYPYSIFVNTVAENLGVDPQVVLDKMADGRVFAGRQAVDVGLASEVATLDEVVAKMNESYKKQIFGIAASAAAAYRTDHRL